MLDCQIDTGVALRGSERRTAEGAASVSEPIPRSLETIFAVNKSGWQQLMGSSTMLSDAALRFLVLVDGKLSLGQIAKHLNDVPEAKLRKIVFDLEFKGYIQSVKFGEPAKAGEFDVLDFFADQSSDSTAGSGQGDQDFVRKLQEAQSFTAMLKQQGYVVRIARQAGEAAKPASGGAYSVLFVEDNPALSAMVRKLFELEGFVPRLAANRDEIVAELRKAPLPDLMLLEAILPGISGFDILQRVRNHPMLKQIPVIMVAEMTSREDVMRALAAGANGFITKPFEFDVLMNSVKAVLGLE